MPPITIIVMSKRFNLRDKGKGASRLM